MISTFSKFYYIESVDDTNYSLNFNEGAAELEAQIAVGGRTPTDLASAVQDALNDAGGQTYTVTFNRSARTFTIAASSNFSLLITSGSQLDQSIFSLIGFTGADLSGANSYTGSAAASEYLPQFKLQSYVDQEDLQEAVQGSINESAKGDIEVVSFGTRKFFELNITFITDIEQDADSVIESNASGVSSARLFMRFITSKRKFEFIPDRDDVDTFHTVLLESTEEHKDGLGYRLKEMYAKGLPGFFETGLIRLRLVED